MNHAAEAWPFTIDLLVLLSAAAVLAIVGQRLRLAIIPAYLITGVLIGPHALGWVHSPQSLEAIGQLAIILLLFGIGLELNFAVMRSDLPRMVLAGILSCALSILAGWPVAMVFGLSAPAALVACMALSLSSTAVVLRSLAQHRELSQTRGRLAFSILIVQDLLVLLMFLGLPALRAWDTSASAAAPPITHPATQTAPAATLPAVATDILNGQGLALPWQTDLPLWAQLAINAVVLASVFIVGRLVLPRLLAETARHRSTESMMILSVAVAIGAAVVTEWLGFGAALGAFLAGLLLSYTPFRYHLRGQVVPLRNLFIAVFFTTLGMQLDPLAALGDWWIILGGVGLLLLLKTITIALTAWSLGATGSVAVAVGLSLAQAGEFSLVLIGAAQGAGLLDAPAAANLIAIVIVSLVLTPGLIRVGFRAVVRSRWRRSAPWIASRPMHDPGGTDAAPEVRRRVIIAGYGPVGRAIADRLHDADADVVIVDMNPATVERQTHLGRDIIYGDISNPEILEAAGIHQAAALVVTIPDQEAAVRACAVARGLEPSLFIAARTNILSQGMLAAKAGADHVTIDEISTAESMQKAVVDWLASHETHPRQSPQPDSASQPQDGSNPQPLSGQWPIAAPPQSRT